MTWLLVATKCLRNVFIHMRTWVWRQMLGLFAALARFSRPPQTAQSRFYRAAAAGFVGRRTALGAQPFSRSRDGNRGKLDDMTDSLFSPAITKLWAAKVMSCDGLLSRTQHFCPVSRLRSRPLSRRT